jgi:solute carrier family 8 (sodium/calcium exchanger)
MEAIEVITSKKTVVSVEDPNNPGQMVDVERNVWNPTIANLTLMALGSSMPEILLSVFSTVLDLDGVPSALGPAAIVGSASFNLFVISAVSIAAVGDEVK